jgi:hypothetical protein
MGTTNFDVVSANQFIGGGLNGTSPFAQIFYVDGTNGSDGNTGKSPRKAFQTIAAAIAATTSGRGDVIYIAPGTYLQTASLVPKARNIFRAAVLAPREPAVKISGNVADLVQIDVDGVQFHGIEFLATGATTDNLVDIADTVAVLGCRFEGCVFNGADQTSVVGIKMADATFAASSVVVINCIFRDLTGTQIVVGVLGNAYGYIAYNLFALDVNSGTCISLADTTGFAIGKGMVIEHNTFLGFDATKDEVAITISGTEDTTGAVVIRRNDFAYFAVAAVTIDKIGFATIQNYTGDATGGLLLDVGT